MRLVPPQGLLTVACWMRAFYISPLLNNSPDEILYSAFSFEAVRCVRLANNPSANRPSADWECLVRCYAVG